MAIQAIHTEEITRLPQISSVNELVIVTVRLRSLRDQPTSSGQDCQPDAGVFWLTGLTLARIYHTNPGW